MLICWCIGKAASQVEEFYILPEQGKLYQYDRLAINVIVNNRVGGINSCDIPVSRDVAQFNKDYQMLTQKTSDTCESIFWEDAMIVGTSAMVIPSWTA